VRTIRFSFAKEFILQVTGRRSMPKHFVFRTGENVEDPAECVGAARERGGLGGLEQRALI
jgi:hypothetical protein